MNTADSKEKEEEGDDNNNENEIVEEDDIYSEHINIYNKTEFELENVIQFFFNKEILERVKFWPK